MPGLTTTTRDYNGVTITESRDPTGTVRQQRAQVGELAVVSNSPRALERWSTRCRASTPASSDEPDLRYMLARDPGAHQALRVPQRQVHRGGDRPAAEGAGGAPAAGAGRAADAGLRGAAARLAVRTGADEHRGADRQRAAGGGRAEAPGRRADRVHAGVVGELDVGPASRP
jgi:hypothetical protein